MILFFHFLCLIARYIVINLSKTFKKSKTLSDESVSEVKSSFTDSSENCTPRSLHLYPKYPSYENGFLKFFPPVFVQRYETVALLLQDAELEGKIRKVVDFGCAELGFFVYLKNIETIREILAVDIDSDLLERYSYKAAPLTSDYLMGKREFTLDVYILAGNVAEYDDRLMDCDAVIAIELIEHLNDEDLNKMSYNIFNKIKPKVAIFTTPNADFNTLLPNLTNMRHKDHKFEWSRKEFFKWTQQILNEYPEYHVRFFGIGIGPEGTENLGCCTQMAVFKRLEDSESFITSRDSSEVIKNYKLIKHYEFPAYVDNRTTEEKIVDKIQYHASYLKRMDKYYNFETNQIEIPFSLLKEYVSDFHLNDNDLLEILNKSGMTFKEENNAWFIVYSDSDSFSSDHSSENLENEDILMTDTCDNLEDRWSDEEQPNEEKIQSGKSLKVMKESSDESHLRFNCENESNRVQSSNRRSTPVIHATCDSFFKTDNLLQNSPSFDVKNQDTKQSCLKRNLRHKIGGEDAQHMNVSKTPIFSVCSPFKISRSSSLDSCFKNFNPLSEESYLSLVQSSSSPYPGVSPLSSFKKNHSDSSLLSSSFDKAGDSGYPFSYSPPSQDLTPKQVKEFFTEDKTSRSTSPCSDIYDEAVNDRVHHDNFVEIIPMENGDVANNNRDGEGNNVEGL